MQELEKILEEIKRLREMYNTSAFSLLDNRENLSCEYDRTDIEFAKSQVLSEVVTIIRKHMNDTHGRTARKGEITMTENEAIEIICDKIETCEFYFAEHDRYPEWCDYEFLQALGKAIFALKEVQRYQEIGTVEECKELASMVTAEKKNVLGQIVDEWKEYIEIGTVEECRKAVEKQKPKKIHSFNRDNLVYKDGRRYRCPICECEVDVTKDYEYCSMCGQKIEE